MSLRKKYVFKINGYTPASLPMERLALYLGDLAKMLGEPENIHFVEITEGSAKLAWAVDEPAQPTIHARLNEIATGTADVVFMDAYRSLNRRLKEDRTDAAILPEDGTGELLPFPGAKAPAPIEFTGIPKAGSLDGVVIRIGGKREEIHVAVQTTNGVFRCVASKVVAKALAGHMFDVELRIHGTGRWNRNDEGRWTLHKFVISNFELLDTTPISEVFADLRSLGEGAWSGDNLWADALEIRGKPN